MHVPASVAEVHVKKPAKQLAKVQAAVHYPAVVRPNPAEQALHTDVVAEVQVAEV